MRKVLSILFVSLGLFYRAQPPSRFYTKFGTSGDDIGYSAKPTLDRQYIVAGSTSGFGSTDVYLTKVDSMGQLIWSKNIGGINVDVGKSVIQLPDSGYVVAGFTSSFGAGGYDAYLVRTDKNGNFIWQRTFGGTDWDFANDLVFTSDNHIAVVGNTTSFGSGQKDGFVLIYDLSGNLIKQKFYGGAENEELRAIISTNDGFLACTGYTESRYDVNGDMYFIKLDLNGDSLFTRTYGGSFKDYANDLVQKSNGDYIICGAKTLSLNATSESAMYSMDSNGTLIWQNTDYKAPEFISASNSYQLSYLTGYLRSRTFNVYNKQGEIYVGIHGGWPYLVNSSGGFQDEYLYSIEGTKDGGYISVGSTLSFGSFGTDVYLIKNDSTIINYSSIVGVSETKQTEFPPVIVTRDNLTISTGGLNPEQVTISDILGTILYQKEGYSETSVIDISTLPPGIFIICIKDQHGQIFYHKFQHFN